MCNLYNVTTAQQAILALTRAMTDRAGNLEPSLNIYPDYSAPIVRQGADGVRELVKARWGMPTSRKVIFDATAARANKLRAKGKTIDDAEFARMLEVEPDVGVTNIRNLASPHWKPWQGVANRCVVPATSFSEYGAQPDPLTKRKPLHWFGLDQTCPLFVFAGIWTPWKGVRKAREGEVETDIFGFLTCPPNSVVAPIHPKAMPVILATAEDIETWLTAPWGEAMALQRPLPDEMLQIVAAPVKEVT